MHIRNLNTVAIRKFRQEFAHIPLVHFISPAYFSRGAKLAKSQLEAIKSIVKSNDFMALHLQGWKSLVEGAGVRFRNEPNFWGYDVASAKCREDCGQGVPVSSYNKGDLDKIVSFNISLYERYLGTRPLGLLAGGWMGTPEVLEIARKHQILYDFSAIPPVYLKDKLQYYPIYDWVSSLWKQVHNFTQPLQYLTKHGWVTGVANNGGNLPYQNRHAFFELFKSYGERLKKSPTKKYFIHFGFYQEHATRHIPQLRWALKKIFAYSDQNDLSIEIFGKGTRFTTELFPKLSITDQKKKLRSK